jgi:hypothetical protein
MRRVISLLLGAAVLAATAVAAGASTIVVPERIGGVRLGMERESARKAWQGPNLQCESRRRCTYKIPNRPTGSAILEFQGNRIMKVSSVELSADIRYTQTESIPVFRGPLMKIRTKSGIGLGTPFARVVRAFPEGRRRQRQHITTYRVPGKRGVMSFLAYGPGRRVHSIELD